MTDNYEYYLTQEFASLTAQTMSLFWKKKIKNIFASHSVQKDFILIKTQRPTIAELKNYFSELANESKNEFSLDYEWQNNGKSLTIFLQPSRLAFSDSLKPHVTIDFQKNGLLLRINVWAYGSKSFQLDEYFVLENILRDLRAASADKNLCQEISRLSHLCDLTTKETEIAKASIKAICDANAKTLSCLEQDITSSALSLNGKTVKIFHKDFLENPTGLLKLLK